MHACYKDAAGWRRLHALTGHAEGLGTTCMANAVLYNMIDDSSLFQGHHCYTITLTDIRACTDYQI